MANNNTGNAFKKMSQRAMWRGDRGQSQMLESHGMAGMRSNLLNDTPTYKKEAIGLNGNNGFNFAKKSANNSAAANIKAGANNGRNNNTNTKVKNSVNLNSQNQNKGLGSSILNSL